MTTVTTSRDKVLEMLFEGALSFTASAKKYALTNNTEKRVYYINRACAIFNDLLISLDYTHQEEMSTYLNEAYVTQIRLLSEANLENNVEKLDLVINNITYMLDEWRTGKQEYSSVEHFDRESE